MGRTYLAFILNEINSAPMMPSNIILRLIDKSELESGQLPSSVFVPSNKIGMNER